MKIWSIFRAILLSVIIPGMLESYCIKCGTRRVGQALRSRQYQTCYKCGAKLEIMENGRRIGVDFLPFADDKYLPKPPDQVSKSDEQSEERDKEQP